MANRVAKTAFISEADYLAGEKIAETKHEYIDGEVFAMAGASASHNRISLNVARKFGNHLEDKPCQPYISDMKVKVGTKYFYPDVLVDCSGLADDSHVTEKPTLIVEVLSKSTRRMDETTKRIAYTQIDSLLEYVLIEQDFVDIEIIRRRTGWQSERFYLGDSLTFESIALTLTVEDIYARVNNPELVEWRQLQAEANSESKLINP
ncbi:MAG TPA: Uma2 family endonuclease [Agitococcus sp.]|nr:Uma2 family endonuclease [Agitococcus sp.]HNB19789.1 Uma2 family endonuclease [Agitococcus sp.]HNH43680.1 Uma2 family endonuclease [Agitococcus sp.]HNI63936.1 Uma2 family endonuclease [Agitococcus sp.]HNP01298.1 Uma2 family endonuclease [Agitococcus sp.]